MISLSEYHFMVTREVTREIPINITDTIERISVAEWLGSLGIIHFVLIVTKMEVPARSHIILKQSAVFVQDSVEFLVKIEAFMFPSKESTVIRVNRPNNTSMKRLKNDPNATRYM